MKADDLHFAPEVEGDLAQAFDGYERQREGLGEYFLICLEACLDRVARAPQAYSFVYKEYRRALLRRFPYAVFYEYGESAVTVYAVLHTSRDPSLWRKRLQ